MKKAGKLIAFGVFVMMLISAVPVLAGNTKKITPSPETRMVFKPDLRKDLSFGNVWAKMEPDGSSFTIQAKVANYGKKNAGPFKVTVFYKSNPVHEFDVAGLKVGEVKSLAFSMRIKYVKDSHHHWKFVFDSEDQIDESNENNNHTWADFP